MYDGRLPITERVSANVLCLPMFSHMREEDVEKVCDTIQKIHSHGHEISRTLS